MKKKFKEIEIHQWKTFKNILEHHYSHNKFYHQKLKDAQVKPSDISIRNDLLKLPSIKKDELRGRKPELIADNINLKDCYSRSTSGSTGTPITIQFDTDALLQKIAINLRTCEMSHYRLGDKLLQTQKLLEYGKEQRLLNTLLRRKYSSPFDDNIERTLQVIRSFKPDALVGYTSYIKILADYYRKNPEDLSIQSIITNCEVLLDNVRTDIEHSFNSEVFDHYGSIEFGRISGECCQHQGYHINSDSVLVEFIKDGEHCAAGEQGEIFITSLVNKAQPLIRYHIEDIGNPIDGLCSCGIELPLMMPILGRIQDILMNSKGEFVLPDKARHIIRAYEEIKQFQVIQKQNLDILVQIVEEIPLNKKNEKLMKQNLSNYLGGVKVEIEYVDEIPRKKGKHHYIISRIKRARFP